jgi:hypothetical protein
LNKLCSATPLTKVLDFIGSNFSGALHPFDDPALAAVAIGAGGNHSSSDAPTFRDGQKKTLPIVRRAVNMKNIILSRLDLTYLSRYSIGMELAPYFQLALRKHQQVVKASSGHFPQPFLIRDVLRTAAKIYCLSPYFQISGVFL